VGRYWIHSILSGHGLLVSQLLNSHLLVVALQNCWKRQFSPLQFTPSPFENGCHSIHSPPHPNVSHLQSTGHRLQLNWVPKRSTLIGTQSAFEKIPFWQVNVSGHTFVSHVNAGSSKYSSNNNSLC